MEAQQNVYEDHRAIAQRLDLLHFQEEAPGMVFWHPRGFALYRVLEEAARRQLGRDGYAEVRTPQLLRRSIWEQSGHWSAFGARHMFSIDVEGASDEVNAAAAAMKPVSCPGHIQLFSRAAPSWRDLPMRLAEFGLVHRDEPSGSLHGLLRLRQFTQDDGHIFCAPEQVVEEVARFVRAVAGFYAGFGFDQIVIGRSLRPAERLGDEAAWDQAEQWLADGASAAGLAWRDQPGEGAFYGPKLEFALEDRSGKLWQCGTIQLDLVMPERFGIGYIDAQSKRARPVMLHRALYGSLERFMGMLLEHHQGRLPAWLAPEQIRVLPISPEAHGERASKVLDALRGRGLRAELDASAESLGKRVALARSAAVPLVAVLGDRELEQGSINLRDGANQRSMPLWAALEHLVSVCAPPGA
jgi:threonyl-tRNA synthetase